MRKDRLWSLKRSQVFLFHFLELALDSLKRFHVVVKRFLHLLINRHNFADRISLLFFILMYYFEFYFIESFAMGDNIFICFIELIEFRCCIFDNNFFVRMNKFCFSSICSSYFKIRTVLSNI